MDWTLTLISVATMLALWGIFHEKSFKAFWFAILECIAEMLKGGF